MRTRTELLLWRNLLLAALAFAACMGAGSSSSPMTIMACLRRPMLWP